MRRQQVSAMGSNAVLPALAACKLIRILIIRSSLPQSDQPTSSANGVSWSRFQADMSNFPYSPDKMRSFINVVDVSLHSFTCIVLCFFSVSLFCFCIIRSSCAVSFVRSISEHASSASLPFLTYLPLVAAAGRQQQCPSSTATGRNHRHW